MWWLSKSHHLWLLVISRFPRLVRLWSNTRVVRFIHWNYLQAHVMDFFNSSVYFLHVDVVKKGSFLLFYVLNLPLWTIFIIWIIWRIEIKFLGHFHIAAVNVNFIILYLLLSCFERCILAHCNTLLVMCKCHLGVSLAFISIFYCVLLRRLRTSELIQFYNFCSRFGQICVELQILAYFICGIIPCMFYIFSFFWLFLSHHVFNILDLGKLWILIFCRNIFGRSRSVDLRHKLLAKIMSF